MRTCLLHAGVSKTGTTVIQGFLEQRRDALLARGLDLPRLGYGDIVEAGRALAMELREERDPDGPATPSWRALDRHLAETSGDFCLTRESFGQSLSRRAGSEFVADFFARRGVKLKVVVFVRETVDFINSAYVQNAKRLRLSQPFAAWVEGALAPGDPRFSAWLMFRHLIGREDVTIVARPFGRSGEGPLADFLEAVGHADLDRGTFDDAPFRNASPGPKAVAAGIEIGRALAPKGLSPAALVRYGEVFDAALAARGWVEAPFYGPDEALARRVAAHFAADDERFARRVWGEPWSSRIERRVRPRNEMTPGTAGEGDRAEVADLVRETLSRGARRELWRRAFWFARRGG